MSETARERANRVQLAASDPAVSAFVGASAGSGKTKLLTDRLLRLMLSGARLDRIQCLTFTKAAAAEMAVRLQRTLGRWVTLSDDALANELQRLEIPPTEESLAAARALFAQVLDLAGGMRIGTIHAFSQSLLRRFPLEAQISPHFQLVDERDAEDTLIEAREDMLSQAPESGLRDALETLAGLATASGFGEQVMALQADRDRLERALRLGPDLTAAQRRVLGVTGDDEAAVLAGAVQWLAEHQVRDAFRRIAEAGSPTVRDRAFGALDWLALAPDARTAAWETWRAVFLRDDGAVRGPTSLVNKKLGDVEPHLLETLLTEADRILAVDDACRAIRVAAVSASLLQLAAPVVRGYARRKDDGGLLDYEDLIGRTSRLLVDPGAAWVLYKLDGGLDHLLLDEVQDTSPRQWDIAHALTGEFFTGAGARDTHRTVFAVGDPKQSIYSFQGADMAEFERSRGLLATRVRHAGQEWRDQGLDVSFRSAAPVLELVDAVFADPIAAAGVVEPGQALRHYADRSGHAGRVELWPLTPVPASDPPQDWTVPARNQGMTSAPQLLADTLADWIREQTGGDVILESRGRPLRPGDVMVLVRRRNAFARALVRALKLRGVPVAGLDRLVLTEQPAVQDLMALCEALLLPRDDLTLACVLTSPLGGLTDDDLMALAIHRRGALWDGLQARADENPAWRCAVDFIRPLLARVDFATPYALMVEALGPLGGRARLFGRLGAEAAEPIDEFLNAALTYSRAHPPSLQGFLHWLRRSGAEVKREAEAAGDLVRVMTVHGAKGLQAPLVILPDTTALPPDGGGLLWADDPATGVAVPLWSPRREVRCEAIANLRAAAHRRTEEEHNRLLYVALTRAEDRLLICGHDAKRPPSDSCWYRAVERGFRSLAAEGTPFAPWEGEVLSLASAQTVPPDRPRATSAVAATATLPRWMGSAPSWRALAPPEEPARPRPLAPSRPDGAALGAVPPAVSPLAERAGDGDRFRRGQLIHALLQHLPSLPAEAWESAAAAWLDRPGIGIEPDARDALVREVMAVLSHPDLAPLFGPDSRAEVPLTGVIGESVVGGLVDRLVVLERMVLVADFKTNRRPPARAQDTPVLYLRQMAAYRAVLRSIFPGRAVRCALIWTREARVSLLPDEILDGHDPAHGDGSPASS
ncbi:MAG: double-strand break repair helicase AddA [Acetobacteraceae bacterium]